MIIQNLSNYSNSRAPEILSQAQTISNFFLDALEQNDCNVKVVIGFYFEIEDSINTATDIANALSPAPVSHRDTTNKDPRGSNSINTPSRIIKTPEGMDQAVKALKDKCFDCKLSLPKIKFEKDFRFSYNKLSAQLDIYKTAFPKLERPRLINYCHVSFALQKSCIPDILKVIALLLSAFSAVMALNKLPKITLGVFVKVIIGKLMASVVANIKLSVDMSQTGLPCILSAIEEIARAIPTKQKIYDLPMSEEVREQLFPSTPYTTISGKVKQPFVPESVFMRSQNAKLSNKEITKEEYDRSVQEYQRRNNPAEFYAKQLRQQADLVQNRAETLVSESFGVVSDVLTRAQDDVNAYIQSLLGVLDYFECENARTGSDFSELIEYISKLQEVINLFSSIISIWLKKLFEPLLCMDAVTTKDIRAIISQTKLPPLSNQDLADILADFTGSVTKLSTDGNSVLIYDKPAKPLLPKLTLLGCNLKEFAEAHTVDNIISTVIDELTKPSSGSNNTNPGIPDIFNSISNLPIGLPNSPVRVPPSNYYSPIPITIPNTGGRVLPEKIPLTLLEGLRALRPTGTKKVIPFIKPNFPMLPSGTSPNKQPGKVLPPNTKYPSLPIINKIIDTIKDIDNKTGTVIDKITIPSNPNGGGLPTSIIDEIDDILDFIYNPPKPSETNSIDDYIYPSDREDDNENTIDGSFSTVGNSFYKENKIHKSQQECKSFDDVLNILDSLKI